MSVPEESQATAGDTAERVVDAESTDVEAPGGERRRQILARISEPLRKEGTPRMVRAKRLDDAPLQIKRRRFFRAKGAPRDLRVYRVKRASA